MRTYLQSVSSSSIAWLTVLASLGCASAPSQSGPPAAPAETKNAAPLAAPTASAAPSKLPYPGTAKRPVTNDYGTAKVTDDYQWLEADADAAIKEWSTAQNALARSVLDALPNRAAVHDRVQELQGGRSASYGAPGEHASLVPRGKVVFALKREPRKQQPFLVALSSLDDTSTERVVVDPNAIDPSGKTTIDFFAPSLDGKLVVVSLSEGGTEDGTLHIFDAATGKPHADVVPLAQKGTGGGSVAWNKDGSGFWYTRYPHHGERPDADLDFYQQIYFHKLGTPVEKDAYALGKDSPRIAEFELETSGDGALVLAKMKYGDGGEQEFYLLRAAAGAATPAAWTKIASKSDNVREIAFGRDGWIYVLSRAGAPHGKVLRMPAGKPLLASALLVVPEGPAVIEQVVPTRARLYLADLVGGPSQIRVISLEKQPRMPSSVAIAPVSSVEDIVPLDGDDVVFFSESYVDPPAWYRFHADSGKTAKTALAETSTVDFGDTEVLRETCVSKDGTKVPLNVVRAKGTSLDGSHPFLLTAYGGYGISRVPRFRPITRLWLDQGGVFGEANLRGGGEFGDEWHSQGNLTKKQNVFDDFAACMKAVVDLGYTKADRLAIMGGSNGGLLMGAAVTQHPDRMKAVVSLFGIYDMARFELESNGAFNVTELGTMKDPELAKVMLGYSPYHNVKDGTAYPAVLFLHGDNDPRVAPWQSRKMLARMQAATASSEPILLRTSGGQGHVGASLDAIVERDTDIYAFLFSELKVAYRPRNDK